MSRKFLTAVDLSKNEIQNAAVHNLPSAPASPVKGQLYFNTTAGDNTLYWWDGTTWIPSKDSGAVAFGGVRPEIAFGLESIGGIATTASRSDHGHGTPLHGAAQHSTIPISALAPATGPINMGGNPINNVGAPVAPDDAANKGYVDNAIAGLSWKDSVRLSPITDVPLSGLADLDGVTPLAGDRILVRTQIAGSQNGIYIASAGSWTRAPDADTGAEMLGAAVFVEEGTASADKAWVCISNAPITIDTSPLTFVQFAGGGAVIAGNGLTQSGNIINVAGDASMVISADAISRAALTGDVVAVAGGNATTIANLAVTNAKIAANAVTNDKLNVMPANTIKGRYSSTGDPQDLAPSTVKAILGYANGYSGGTAAGTTTVLTHNLGTQYVHVSVWRATAPFDEVECDVEHTSSTTVTLRFATAVTANEYLVTVVGA